MAEKEIEALKTALPLEKQGKMFYQWIAKDTESRAVKIYSSRADASKAF